MTTQNALSFKEINDKIETAILGLNYLSNTNSNQKDYEEKLQTLENNFQEYKDFLAQELEMIEEPEVLINLKRQNSQLSELVACIPKHILSNPNPQILGSVAPAAEEKQAGQSRAKKEKPANQTAAKTQTPPSSSNSQIQLITLREFQTKIPTYVLGHTTLEKLNSLIEQLNIMFKDKQAILTIPENKLKPFQKQVVDDYKATSMKETAGRIFLLEKELREKQTWTSSKFNFTAACRNVLIILRTCGRIREVRGSGHVRYVIL